MGQVTIGSAKEISDGVRLIEQVKKAIMRSSKIDAQVVMSEVHPSIGIDVTLTDFGNITPTEAKNIMEEVALAISWTLIVPPGKIKVTMMHSTLTYVL